MDFVKCEICNVEVKQSYLKRHINRVHNKKPTEYAECPHCDKSVKKDYLSKHIRYMHTDPEFRKATDEHARKYRKSHPEAIKRSRQKWLSKPENKELNRKSNDNWRKKNLEKINARQRETTKCPICDLVLSKASIKRHMDRIHDPNRPPKKKKQNERPRQAPVPREIKTKLSEMDKLRLQIANAEKRKAIKHNLQIKENVVLEF